MTDLACRTEAVGPHHRYVLSRGDKVLLTSGLFLHERDARSVGEALKDDPEILHYLPKE